MRETIFMYFLTFFNILDFCFSLRGGLGVIALTTIGQLSCRDNFDKLQTSKFCLLNAIVEFSQFVNKFNSIDDF